jgi:hypothetical protein
MMKFIVCHVAEVRLVPISATLHVTISEGNIWSNFAISETLHITLHHVSATLKYSHLTYSMQLLTSKWLFVVFRHTSQLTYTTYLL